MPTWACRRTASVTASATRAERSLSATVWPPSRARKSALMLSGRGMLPTCVVRIRVALVFIGASVRRSGSPASVPTDDGIVCGTTMTLPRDLGDGLSLRRGRATDARALALFNADVLRAQDSPEPNDGLAGWTEDLMTGRHPWFVPEEALIVEDAPGRSGTAGMLVSHTLAFDGSR